MRARIAVMALAATALAAPVEAQRLTRVEVAPTAGYLVPGDIARGPLGTALRAAGAPMVGASLAVRIAGPASLYISGALSNSDLEVGLPVFGGIPVTGTRLLMADGGLQLRGEAASAPLVQLGVGTMHYRVSAGPIDVVADNVVLSAAAGYDLALSPGIGLRIMAKDWVGRFDSSDAILVDAPVRTAHNLGLSAGLRFAF